MVGAEGFEPPTLCSQSRCATRLRYAPTVRSMELNAATSKLYRDRISLERAVFSPIRAITVKPERTSRQHRSASGANPPVGQTYH